MHHLNATLASLLPPQIIQVAGESKIDFEKREKCVKQVQEMLKTINTGENCTPQAMKTLNTLLSDINAAVINPNLIASGGGDSKAAFDLLCKIMYPSDEIFFGGSRWHHENLDKISPSGFDPTISAQHKFAEVFATIGGPPEIIKGDTCEVRYVFPNKIDFFPQFFTFKTSNANGNYTKDFPETFELCTKDENIPHAKYELTGMSITGPDHSYLEKVNGKWVQYESTAIIKELTPIQKTLLTSGSNTIYMPFYRRIS